MRDVIVDYLSLYYTDRSPETVWVVELDGQVVGYLLGCSNTREFLCFTVCLIMPRLILRALSDAVKGNYKDPMTKNIIKWALLKSWFETPYIPLRKFASHFHCNLLPRASGKGYFTALALAFLDQMQKQGVTGFHARILEPRHGPFKRMLDRFMRSYSGDVGFYAERPSSFHRWVLGWDKEMVNRVWGGDITVAKEVFRFLHNRYGL